MEELESNVTVEESKSVRLGCSIPSQSSRDSRFSVSWYVQRFEDADADADADDEEGERKKECVFSIGHDAVFGNGNCSPRDHGGPNSRLQFERMTSDQYSLTIHGALPTDAGRYYCHVEEWLLNPRSAWYRLTTNDSGSTIVNVLPLGTTSITVTLTFSRAPTVLGEPWTSQCYFPGVEDSWNFVKSLKVLEKSSNLTVPVTN